MLDHVEKHLVRKIRDFGENAKSLAETLLEDCSSDELDMSDQGDLSESFDLSSRNRRKALSTSEIVRRARQLAQNKSKSYTGSSSQLVRTTKGVPKKRRKEGPEVYGHDECKSIISVSCIYRYIRINFLKLDHNIIIFK